MYKRKYICARLCGWTIELLTLEGLAINSDICPKCGGSIKEVRNNVNISSGSSWPKHK